MARLDAPDRQRGQHQRHQPDDAHHTQQPLGRIGVKRLAHHRGRHRNAKNHHQPSDRRRRRPPPRMRDRGQQRQKRGARGPHPRADHSIGQDRQRQPCDKALRHQHKSQSRQKSAQPQRGHAQNDKPRAIAAGVRAVAPRWPRDLHRVMQAHQEPRQQRRQSRLDHHQPVQRRGANHHNRAKAQLHRPQPKNRHPRKIGHGKASRLRSAKAVIIMPLT